MKPVRILGLGGSMSQSSSSLAALDLALAAARELGAETEMLSVRDLDLPLYRRIQPDPPDAERLVDAVRRADGLVWSSPLYHGTISGSFKNALDWLQLLSRDERPYLTDKVVGLIASAGGVQGLQAINTMEYVVRALRGWTVPLVVPIARGWKVFDEAGNPRDDAVAGQLQALAREVVVHSRRFARD